MKAKIPILCVGILLFMTVGAKGTLKLDVYEDTVIQPGDELNIVNTYNDATVGMTGGNVIDLHTFETSVFNFFNGQIDSLYLSDSSTLYMYGGQIGSAIRLSGSAKANILGGDIGPEISIHDSAVAIFHGSNFLWEDTGTGRSGFLSGYLVDDTPFRTYLRGLPEAFPGSHVVLIPEPCTLLMFAIGTLSLSGRRIAR